MASDYWFYSVGPVVRSSAQPRHARILPHLFIGEYLRPDDAAWLREQLGVTSVLCLQDAVDLAGKALVLSDLAAAYRARQIDFQHAPVPDGEQHVFVQRLPAIVATLAGLIGAQQTVYLHCNAGMNRAPTVAIAYLHEHGGMSLDAARDFVKQRHPCVPYMTMLGRYYDQR
jgi:protein-tyrosine phosphatase